MENFTKLPVTLVAQALLGDKYTAQISSGGLPIALPNAISLNITAYTGYYHFIADNINFKVVRSAKTVLSDYYDTHTADGVVLGGMYVIASTELTNGKLWNAYVKLFGTSDEVTVNINGDIVTVSVDDHSHSYSMNELDGEFVTFISKLVAA